MKQAAPRTLERLLAAALGAGGRPVLVLDDQLRVQAHSHEAEALLGRSIPAGMSAPALLCGDRPKRPIADALAEGRAVQVVVPMPGQPGAQLRVTSQLLEHEDRRLGWLLHLQQVADLPDGEAVEFRGMWTQDARMKDLFRVITRVAGEDVTVLVRGETGAGKELVAHALHELSSRRSGPFRAINCAALPANLLESELFGHTRGAFTGAHRDVAGHIQLAHGGTLFLDEVAEMPLEVQAKLLRVLEDHVVVPVGGREPVRVDVRVVSATHRALRQEVEAGRFRADLMYRLRVIPVFLPPLRERPGDVELLVTRFLHEYNQRGRRQVKEVDRAAMRALARHDWPGNVRELRNVLSYVYAIGDGPVLVLADLPPELREGSRAGSASAVPPGDDDEARRIRDALVRSGGKREEAARLLGLSRSTLWRRMRFFGLEPRSAPAASR